MLFRSGVDTNFIGVQVVSCLMETSGDNQGNDGGDAALAVQQRRIHRVSWISGVLWVLATLVCTLWGSDRFIAGHLNDAAENAENDTKAVSSVVNRIFHELAAIPQVMSSGRDLIALVARYNAREDEFSRLPEEQRRKELQSDPVIARLAERLTLIRNKLNYDLIFIVESHGIRILTSDWDQPVALLGERIDDREYFKEAMAGETGHMFVVSRNTKTPSFFFSAPIRNESGVIGAVVARQDYEHMGSMLAGTQHVTMIVSRDGMVLAASHPGFALRHLGALTDRRPDPDTLRNIYSQQTLRSLTAERPSHVLHEAQWVIDGKPYLASKMNLAVADYSLLVLTSTDSFTTLRPLCYAIGTLVALFGVLVILLRDRRALTRAQRRHDAMITTALNEKLTLLNMDKDRYLGIAAHDLRNPLSSMRGLSQLMLEMPLEPPQEKEFLETIHRTSDEMLGLVNDLLDVSVIESGKLVLKRTDQDIVKMVQRRVRHLDPHARSKNIAVAVDTPDGQRASIDGARFNQVVDNLVGNAIKFSPPGTTVKVSLRSSDGNLLFSVQDQGPGISEEDRKLLFRSFQKLSARPTGGEKSTGLGLAIVKKIVDAHGGHITVDKAPGGGTVFTVTVPAGG
jgi:signal transduction histidine kinase